MTAISGQSIDAGPHKKMGADLKSRAKQFVDVALPIADVDTALRLAEKHCGLLEVFQPADAFLLLNGDSRRIDLPLECCRTLELLPVPELDGGKTKWKPVGRHCEA